MCLYLYLCSYHTISCHIILYHANYCCDFVLFACRGQWWGGGICSFQPYEASGALPSNTYSVFPVVILLMVSWIEMDCASRPSVTRFYTSTRCCSGDLLSSTSRWFGDVLRWRQLSSFRWGMWLIDPSTSNHMFTQYISKNNGTLNWPIKTPLMLSRKNRLMPNNGYHCLVWTWVML